MKQNPLNQYSNISPQSIHIINLIPMNYKKIILALTVATSILAGHAQQKEPVDYVNPLMGTDSKISLSNGNTYTHRPPLGHELLDAPDRKDG